MRTEQVLHRLDSDVAHPEGESVNLKKEDAKLILNRIQYLERIATALLRSQLNPNTGVVLPYRPNRDGAE